MDWEEKISRAERITLRVAGFLLVLLFLMVAVIYSAIEGVKFLIDRFSH